MLDLTVLNGDGVYAELMDNGQPIRSNLNAANVRWPGKQDFSFGQRGDHIYFIEIPDFTTRDTSPELRLGFDENPTASRFSWPCIRQCWCWLRTCSWP
jgi:hypothetical protein